MKAENFQGPKDESGGHEAYMRRALELARLGVGQVSPNPLVGSVIVHHDKIIGEGWHKRYGGPHAEVNAIASVANRSLLSESTLYVNLEPCSHVGKTPPCADLLIAMNIKTVVIANQDSNPLVAGRGIRKLREAGVNVVEDVLADEGMALNRRFFTYMQKRRPRILLKWAETSDGFIARDNGDSRWISDACSRQLVHKWRSEEDAILVGSGTASQDNPQLNVRDWSGRDPVRILIDRNLTVSTTRRLFDGSQRTLCYNLLKDEGTGNVTYVRLPREGFLDALVHHLYDEKIQSVIIEGGAHILNAFINAGLWDEARVFISPQTFSTGIRAPQVAGVTQQVQKLDKDWLKIVFPAAAAEKYKPV